MSSLLKSIIGIILVAAAITVFVMVSQKNNPPLTESNYIEYNNSNPSTGKDGLCVSQVTFPNMAGTSCTVTTCDGDVSTGVPITNSEVQTLCKDMNDFSCLVKQCGAIEDVELKEINCYEGYNSVSYVTNSQGGIVGCELHKCGGGSDYVCVDSDPSAGCGGEQQQEFECVVDGCISNSTGETNSCVQQTGKGGSGDTKPDDSSDETDLETVR